MKILVDLCMKLPQVFLINKGKIMKIWDGSIIYELSEMVIEQDDGMVVPKYLSWFKKRVIIADIPEGSSRKRKDQQTIE